MNKDAGMSFTAGLLVGAIIGVAVGFLYAPRTGEETREMLREKAELMKERAGEVAEKVKQTATEAAHTVEAKLPRKQSQV
jgi:gas vesicle protein